MNKPPKSKVNHFFSQQLKQSYNYQAQSIVQKKNFLDIDNRFNKKPFPPSTQQQIPRTTSSKIQFYQQQLQQMDHINQNFIQKLASAQIQLKQYHFDVIKLNQQINNLQRTNSQICDKYDTLFKQVKENQKYIGDLEQKMKGIEEIISKLYNTISSSQNTYKDLEYIFSTDSGVEKQLEAICYVMLQCCRQNNLLRKTLTEQDGMIVKLNNRATNAYNRSNVQMEATSKLLTDFEAFNSTITFDQTQNKNRLSPFKTPCKGKYETYDRFDNQRNGRQSRRIRGSKTRFLEDDRHWERDKLKTDLKYIDGEIEKLQAKLIEEMRH